MSKEPKIKLCKICKEPLGDLENDLSRSWHFDCDRCSYCKAILPDPVRIRKCIEEELPVSHPSCYERAIEESFKNSPVTITQGHLDFLNRSRLMWEAFFNPNPEVSVETNQKEAELAFNRFGFGESAIGVNEYSLEEKFLFVQRLQAIAACASITVDKKKVEVIRKQRDADKIKEAQEYREDVQAVDEKKKITTREKEEKKAVLQAEKLNPNLKKERKAIEVWMNNFGMTKDEALEMLKKTKGVSIQ